MAFIVNAVARRDIYVSNVNFGGIPVGSDTTGDGSPGNPYLTWDKGYPLVPQGLGTLYLNGNPASPAVYGSATATVLTASITVRAVFPGGATLRGVGAAEAITVGAIGGMVATLQDVNVDPSLNVGGPGTICFNMLSFSPITSFTLTCKGVHFQNWSGGAGAYAISNALSNFSCNLTLDSCTALADSVAGVMFLNYAAGSIVITGSNFTITNQNVANVGPVVLRAAAIGPTCSILNTNITFGVASGLVGGATHYGIRIIDFGAAVVDGGTHIAGSASASRGADCINIQQATAGLGCSGSIIRTVQFRNTAATGIGIIIGTDSHSDPTLAQNCSVLNCRTVGTSSATMEAIVFGSTINGLVQGCTLDGCFDLGAKDSTGWQCLNNTMTNVQSIGLVDKGNTGSVITGNHVTASGATNVLLFEVEINPETGISCSGGVYGNNTFTVSGGTGATFLMVDATSTFASFSSDTYNLVSGSLSGNPWQVQGVNYPTPGASTFGPAVEPSATFTNC